MMDGPNTHRMDAPSNVTNWTVIPTTREVPADDGRSTVSRKEWWHVPTFVVEEIEKGVATPAVPDAAREAGIDVDAFLAGLDSPNHSPESRRAWVGLILRDLRFAAVVPDCALGRFGLTPHSHRCSADEDRAVLAATPAVPDAPTGWEDEARRYAANADYWRSRVTPAVPDAAQPASPGAAHEHYWVDAADDETGWHCTICGLTEYPEPPFGADAATPEPAEGLDVPILSAALGAIAWEANVTRFAERLAAEYDRLSLAALDEGGQK